MAALALESNIGRIRHRIRVLLAVRWGVAAALVGAVACLLVLIVSHLVRSPIPFNHTILVVALCGIAGAVFGYLRRVSLLQAALSADARLALQERLSSALALYRVPEADPMVSALVEDATRHLEALDLRATYPIRVPRQGRWLAVVLVAMALVAFVPGLPIFLSPRERAERQAMRAEGERIVRIAKEMRKAARTPESGTTRRLASELERLGRAMAAARLGKKEALVRLNKLTREVAEAQKKLALQMGKKPLSQAAKDLRRAAAQEGAGPKPERRAARTPATRSDAASASKRLKEMASALAAKDMERAARLLEEMADRVASGKMSRQELAQMAREAEEMARSLSGTELDEAAQQLREAAGQLRKGETMAAARQLQQAGGT